MNKLTEKKKQLLRDFVDGVCEECHKESDNLQIHRINRGYCGGEYILRNVKVVCAKCHKKYHAREFK